MWQCCRLHDRDAGHRAKWGVSPTDDDIGGSHRHSLPNCKWPLNYTTTSEDVQMLKRGRHSTPDPRMNSVQLKSRPMTMPLRAMKALVAGAAGAHCMTENVAHCVALCPRCLAQPQQMVQDVGKPLSQDVHFAVINRLHVPTIIAR